MVPPQRVIGGSSACFVAVWDYRRTGLNTGPSDVAALVDTAVMISDAGGGARPRGRRSGASSDMTAGSTEQNSLRGLQNGEL